MEVLMMIIYIFTIAVINHFLSQSFEGFELEIMKARFKNNKSPIYAIERANWVETYSVVKYELRYNKNFENIFWLIPFLLIPGAGLLKDYGYIKHERKYGAFTNNQLEDRELMMKALSGEHIYPKAGPSPAWLLMSYWERENDNYLAKSRLVSDKEEWRSRHIADFNSDFKANYKN